MTLSDRRKRSLRPILSGEVEFLVFILPLANIDEMARDSGGRGNSWRNKMRTRALAHPSFEITIARASAAFARLKPVGIHRQAHAATGFAPFEPCVNENFVEPFFFSLAFDDPAARNGKSLNAFSNFISFKDLSSSAEIFTATICARTNEDPVKLDANDRRSRLRSIYSNAAFAILRSSMLSNRRETVRRP